MFFIAIGLCQTAEACSLSRLATHPTLGSKVTAFSSRYRFNLEGKSVITPDDKAINCFTALVSNKELY